MLAIVGGCVVAGDGTRHNDGVVLVADGRIVEVGHGIRVPEEASVVDAAGKWVLPGFIDAHSHIGVHEEANGWAGADGSELSGPNQAGIRTLDAVTIDDLGFEDAVTGGVTAVVVKPGSGNPIGGQSLAMKTWGGRTVDEQLISADLGVKSALGENPKQVYGDRKQAPSTRMGVAAVIRQALLDAAAYAAARDAAQARGDVHPRHLGNEVLARVLTGELQWDQHAHRHDDIATALRLAAEFGLRLVVNHGTEAHRLAPILAARDVPVIFGPVLSTRSKVEVRNASVDHVVELDRAGVRLALTTDHPVVPIGQLRLQAAFAARAGLSWETAIAGITSMAAEIAGIGDRVGRLAPGFDADLVVWSGDPLELAARPELVIIDGVKAAEWTGTGYVLADRWASR
jgi:imidazolonepropionase-like amidohydrolase